MKKYILIFFALMIHSYSIYSMELEQGPATRVSFEIGTKETEIKEEATLTVAPPVENSWQDVFLKSQEEKNRIRKEKRNVFIGGVVLGATLATSIWWVITSIVNATT